MNRKKGEDPIDPNLQVGLLLEAWMIKWWKYLVVAVLLTMMFFTGIAMGQNQAKTIVSPCASTDK